MPQHSAAAARSHDTLTGTPAPQWIPASPKPPPEKDGIGRRQACANGVRSYDGCFFIVTANARPAGGRHGVGQCPNVRCSIPGTCQRMSLFLSDVPSAPHIMGS